MKIKELIKKLEEVKKVNPNSIVWLTAENSMRDFTGISIDDDSDVRLFIVDSDVEA